MMAGSLFAINTEGYCTVTPSQRLVCATHHVMFRERDFARGKGSLETMISFTVSDCRHGLLAPLSA